MVRSLLNYADFLRFGETLEKYVVGISDSKPSEGINIMLADVSLEGIDFLDGWKDRISYTVLEDYLGFSRKDYPEPDLIVFNTFAFEDFVLEDLFRREYPDLLNPGLVASTTISFGDDCVEYKKTFKGADIDPVVIEYDSCEINTHDFSGSESSKICVDHLPLLGIIPTKKGCEYRLFRKLGTKKNTSVRFRLLEEDEMPPTILLKSNENGCFRPLLVKNTFPYVSAYQSGFEDKSFGNKSSIVLGLSRDCGLDSTITKILNQFQKANQDELAEVVSRLQLFSLNSIGVHSANIVGTISGDSDIVDLGKFNYRERRYVTKIDLRYDQGVLNNAFRNACIGIDSLKPFFVEKQFYYPIDLGFDNKKFGVLVCEYIDEKKGLLTKDLSCMRGAYEVLARCFNLGSVDDLMHDRILAKVFYSAMINAHNEEIVEGIMGDGLMKKFGLKIPDKKYRSFDELASKVIPESFKKEYEANLARSVSYFLIDQDRKPDNDLFGIEIDPYVCMGSKYLPLVKPLTHYGGKIGGENILPYLVAYEFFIKHERFIMEKSKDPNFIPSKKLIEDAYDEFSSQCVLSSAFDVYFFTKRTDSPIENGYDKKGYERDRNCLIPKLKRVIFG